MKLFATVFFLLILVNRQSIFCQKLPDIGGEWKGEKSTNVRLYALPPFDFLEMAIVEYDGIKFSLGLRDDTVVYIQTADPDFKIKGKAYVGKTFSSFSNKEKETIIEIPGWGSYIPTEDGWNANFSYKGIDDSSKVIFLFKK